MTNAIPNEEIPVFPYDPIVTQPVVTEFILAETSPLEARAVLESSAQTNGDISVPDGFSLKSERLFNLKIIRSDDDDQAAYLSLCSDYQENSDGSYNINYDSCLLRTSLNETVFETVITVTNDTEGLVAALWFVDGSRNPIIKDWRF
ncbi:MULTISPECIES: hypothetical protein [unclassified Colwellia]|uniref:hypothetical protein n=1 Tax=unclassified Colwellia TaxID=196834 RepID=UPI0015F5F306|nr:MULTISPECIES: hypothetical protein [unclassified Colwellia]MBA6381022.1 hypothetical protein [Colwellia sp. BRX10-7]MBA6388644.1 hypothetical protein [Colwellia sp. BRX10-2]MBA6403511.1 hypothetical protein [Colwellia sp. BRX10-5]MBA6407483.1 hypothetical protein [Colwellia sp. BRX10-1]